MAKKQLKKVTKKVVKKKSEKPTAKKKIVKRIPAALSKKKKSVKKITKKAIKKTVKKKIGVPKAVKKVTLKVFPGKTTDSITKKYERYASETIELNDTFFQSSINIQGIGYNKEVKLRAEGVKNIDDFIALGEQGIARIFGVNVDFAKSFLIKAKANKDNKIYQIKPLSSLDTNCIMLDIETDYFEAKYASKTAWMVGMYDRPTNQFVQYVAHKESEISNMVSMTYEFLNSFSDRKIVIYSGTNSDATILKHRFDHYNRTHNHLNFKDILIEMRNCIAFPFKSMELSHVAEYFDYKFKHPHIDGREVGMAWETHKEDMKKHRSFKKYLEYNEDDVKSLNTVFENIYINHNYKQLQ